MSIDHFIEVIITAVYEIAEREVPIQACVNTANSRALRSRSHAANVASTDLNDPPAVFAATWR
jgi:hypothetical protein